MYNAVQKIATVEDHDNFIQNNNQCIMFFGSHKCRKCKVSIPIFDNIAKNYPQIKFSYVEVTQTTVENLGDELPIFVCYKGNQPVGKVVGANGNQIVDMIQNNFGIQNNYNNNGNNTMRMNNNNSNPTMTEINNINDFNKFISTNNRVVIFFGMKNCPHCINIRPRIEQMVTQYPSVKFAHVEVTGSGRETIPSEFMNSGFPLIVFYKNGQLTDHVLGADEEGIITMIQTRS